MDNIIEYPILGDYHSSELVFVWDNQWCVLWGGRGGEGGRLSLSSLFSGLWLGSWHQRPPPLTFLA